MPGVVGGSARRLRSEVVRCSSVTAAFLGRQAEASRELWKLCHGDLGAKLNSLLATGEPIEPAALNIFKLVRMDFNRGQLLDGLRLLSEVQWSATRVEQAYGETAAIHKTHSRSSSDVLCHRSFVRYMKALVTEQLGPDLLPEALFDGIQQLRHFGGRQVCVLAAGSSSDGQGRVGEWCKKRCQRQVHVIFRQHGSLWPSLPDVAKAACDETVRQLSESKLASLCEEVDGQCSRKEFESTKSTSITGSSCGCLHAASQKPTSRPWAPCPRRG